MNGIFNWYPADKSIYRFDIAWFSTMVDQGEIIRMIELQHAVKGYSPHILSVLLLVGAILSIFAIPQIISVRPWQLQRSCKKLLR